MNVSVCTAKWSNVRTVLALRTMPGALVVRLLVLLMEFAQEVPAWVLRPWGFEDVLPKDLAPLMCVKGRDLMFRARVVRTVHALRTMPGARLVRLKDLLMEQGPIIARDLLAQALATLGIRSKVSAKGRSSDQAYG